MAACTFVSKLKTERKTLHISWCIIRTRGTCVARPGKSTLSALRAKRVNLFRKIRAPASFLLLVISFLILRQRKRANSRKYFAVYSNKCPNFSTVQLPALANKSFTPHIGPDNRSTAILYTSSLESNLPYVRMKRSGGGGEGRGVGG